MAILDDFIRTSYGADPVLAARLANTAYRLVHVSRRYWRGYRTCQTAKVFVDDRRVDEAAVTKNRWKLMPEAMKTDFQLLEQAVDKILKLYCVSGTGREDDPEPVITGGGNYAVLADNWPRVHQLLRQFQSRWAEAADRWCTEDGYENLHALLKAQIGEADYKEASPLVPKREELRPKFGLVVWEVPVRIVEEEGGEAGGARLALFSELLAASIRRPRVDAAEAFGEMAARLVEDGAGGPAARVRYRTGSDGTKTPMGRGVTAGVVTKARKWADATSRCGAAVDAAFAAALRAAAAELPGDEAAAREVAVRLNSDDAEAVRVGKLLLAAATVAADETSMCDAVAAAFASARRG